MRGEAANWECYRAMVILSSSSPLVVPLSSSCSVSSASPAPAPVLSCWALLSSTHHQHQHCPLSKICSVLTVDALQAGLLAIKENNPPQWILCSLQGLVLVLFPLRTRVLSPVVPCGALWCPSLQLLSLSYPQFLLRPAASPPPSRFYYEMSALTTEN